MTLNIRSREFPDTLTKMLASQENVNTALSLQDEDALTLVNILDLDQVSRLMRIGALHLIAPTGFRGTEYVP